jgi:peptidoglycan/LPS O-acetylase OafA/YrhL
VHDAARPGKHPRRDFVSAIETEMTFGKRSFHLGYHRSLDGLRGVAILLVLITHGGILSESGYGFVGVNTFFVLSGFLITCLLILEYEKSNDISLRLFYIRRGLRLLPALITMLLVFVTVAFLSDPRKKAFQEMYEALRALFYFTNWAQIFSIGQTNSLAHTWSLSIEEQFYFIWPVLLLFLLRKNSRNSLLCWVLLGAFLSVTTRVLLSLGTITAVSNISRLVVGWDTRADSLFLGCFVGILVSSKLLPNWKWFAKALKISAMISCVGLLVIGIFHADAPWMICIGWFLASMFAAILVAHFGFASNGLLHRFFENPILVYIGQISYGLYIWHFPILIFMQQHQLPWQHLMYLLPVSIVVLASYYLIERPCLRLKTRFARVN